MSRGERRNLWLGLAFASPWIIGFLVFTLYPVLASVYYSFCDYDVLSKPLWVGTLNYRDMVTDSVFWQSLYNTLYYTALSLPLCLIVALLVAVLLNQSVKGRSAFRTIYFLPSLIPVVASCMVWLWILNGNLGLLNIALSWFHIKGPQWLADEKWTKSSLILMAVWASGNTMVIYLAALQDVPRSLYESAEIDGANAWVKFRHITIPMISPVIYFNLIMGIIASLQTFAQAYIMFSGGALGGGGVAFRAGGPNRSALLYALYLYQCAFDFHQMGYACAMAWTLFLVILFLTWVATRSTRRLIYYGGE
ncbi:MAG TPA: sugar ABC transporter permease [Verrucomicrobiae bacterium]|nr:sugar ABC transporter permease [Verrucomicrobiae bacterium]